MDAIIRKQKEDNIKGYIWRRSFIRQYESLWSIIQRFKLINCLSDLNLNNIFIDENINTVALNMALVNPIDEKNKIIYGMFGVDIKHFKKGSFLFCCCNLPSTNINMSNNLRICPKCMESGYHSFLHQFLFLHKCPWHKIELQENINIDYKISYSSTILAYGCRNIKDLKKYVFPNKKQDIRDIDSEFTNLLREDMRVVKNYIYVYQKLDYDNENRRISPLLLNNTNKPKLLFSASYNFKIKYIEVLSLFYLKTGLYPEYFSKYYVDRYFFIITYLFLDNLFHEYSIEKVEEYMFILDCEMDCEPHQIDSDKRDRTLIFLLIFAKYVTATVNFQDVRDYTYLIHPYSSDYQHSYLMPSNLLIRKMSLEHQPYNSKSLYIAGEILNDTLKFLWNEYKNKFVNNNEPILDVMDKKYSEVIYPEYLYIEKDDNEIEIFEITEPLNHEI